MSVDNEDNSRGGAAGASAGAANASAGEVGRARRILLVEDNPADARLTVEVLRDAGSGHSLSIVSDAYEALAQLRRQDKATDAPLPDLILLDLNLPRMHGREFLQIVKSDPALRRIPVIVLSTSRSESDIRAAYDAHANCYLAKPMDLGEFVSIMQLIVSFWLGAAKLSAD